MIRRFGKPSGDIFPFKQNFFDENEKLLERAEHLADLYRRQPERERCKNCDSPLRGTRFVKQGVTYIICDTDGHLNGAFEDTDEFARTVYADDGGQQYAEVYRSADRDAYQQRVDSIYTPKVRFLLESLEELGEDPHSLTFGELGAGSGYLIAAFKDCGIYDVQGYDVSQAQADLAESMLGQPAVTVHDLDAINDLAATLEVDVIAMMGTLEHVQRPREVLRMLATNRSVRYVFMHLPLFSPSVILETVSQDVWPRHLSGGHTHLYTDRSIDHFCDEFGFARVAEWWFGTDMMDLYRHVHVRLGKQEETAGLSDLWSETFKPSIDELQVQLDRRKLSSQIHLLLGKR